jgi:AMP nucleosidase
MTMRPLPPEFSAAEQLSQQAAQAQSVDGEALPISLCASDADRQSLDPRPEEKHFHAVIGPLEKLWDPSEIVARLEQIYDRKISLIQRVFRDFLNEYRELEQLRGPARQIKKLHMADRISRSLKHACYPYLGLSVTPAHIDLDMPNVFGICLYPGEYGTSITAPQLYREYLIEQITLLRQSHNIPFVVGVSKQQIPLAFAIDVEDYKLGEKVAQELVDFFPFPSLREIDENIANGVTHAGKDDCKPLSLFNAARVDYSLKRIEHYTATSPEFFQKFIIFTNYNVYVDEFLKVCKELVLDKKRKVYTCFVTPGDVVTMNPRYADTARQVTAARQDAYRPQMPAYHLVREDGLGITLVNIGVGPSNAKNITDHLAVLRPHCWLMLGHCAGTRRRQRLGEYILAQGYVRDDHVLDRDLPPFVPIPSVLEVQHALELAVQWVLFDKLRRQSRLLYDRLRHSVTDWQEYVRRHLRKGIVVTTDNRNWEVRGWSEIEERINQSRAVAVEMESATIAGNGFRFQIPYGALLCVSDKPLHGEIKMRSTAGTFYRSSTSHHLSVGIAAIHLLRKKVKLDEGRRIDRESVREYLRRSGLDYSVLHTRQIRGFISVPFR